MPNKTGKLGQSSEGCLVQFYLGIYFLIFTRIRWIGTGSHPYEKAMSIQLSTNIEMYNHKIISAESRL